MVELFFCFKCFIISLFVVFCLQFKIKDISVEARLTSTLRETRSHRWLADMGLGGANLVRAMVAQALGNAAPTPWLLESTYNPEVRETASDLDGTAKFEEMRKAIMEVQQENLNAASAASDGQTPTIKVPRSTKVPSSTQKSPGQRRQ